MRTWPSSARRFLNLREARLLPFDDDAIASLSVEQGGRRLVLTKTEAGYGYEATRPGAAALKGDARSEAVSDWFNALRGAKAERFDPAAPAARASNAKLHVERTEHKPAYDLQLDTSQPSGPVAWREGEPVAMAFAPAAAALLEPSAARVRKLDVVQIPEGRPARTHDPAQHERRAPFAQGRRYGVHGRRAGAGTGRHAGDE